MKKTIRFALCVLFFVAVAFATTAGPRFPGTASGWTNSANVSASDSVYATNSVAGSSDSLQLNTSNYGFSIPSGAIIQGIQVTVIAKASAGGAIAFDDANALGNFGIKLTKVAGTGVGTGHTDVTILATSNTSITFGTTSDLWGTTWTAADVNSSGFGAILKAENQTASAVTASIDSVTITVTYTVTSSGLLQLF